MFSKACQYAMKAMIYIQSTSNDGRCVNLHEIAEAIDSPVAFTSKILQKLKKSGLLISVAGVGGGYCILQNKEITLKQIIINIDGDAIFTQCVLGLKQCDAHNPCPIHSTYATQRSSMEWFLNSAELSILSKQLENGSFSLK